MAAVCLLVPSVLLQAAAAFFAGHDQGRGLEDAVTLLQQAVLSDPLGEAAVEAQKPRTGARFQAGDEVDVEALEGIPGSRVHGQVLGAGSLPGKYNITVELAPPERRFMTNVAPESMQLRKASLVAALSSGDEALPPNNATPSTEAAALAASATQGQSKSTMGPTAQTREAADGPLKVPDHSSQEEQVPGVMDLFSALDFDHDGAISRKEVSKAFSQLAAFSSGVEAWPPNHAAPSAEAAAEAAPEPVAAQGQPKSTVGSTTQTREAAPVQPAARAAVTKGQECWVDGYTQEACCDLYWGPSGDENCWNGIFTFQSCCRPDVKVVEEAQYYDNDTPKQADLKRAQEVEETRRASEEARIKREALMTADEFRKAEQQRAAAEARQRYDAEVRRRIKEEQSRIAREETRKHQREEEARHKDGAGALRSSEACPEGFQYMNGDVPGFDQFGHSDRLKKPQLELCAKECTKVKDCKSFEWSPTRFQCNLNRVGEPKAAKYLDFTFCKRNTANSGRV